MGGGNEPFSLPVGVQTGSTDLENNRQYLVRVRTCLLHKGGEVPEVPLLNSFSTETLSIGAIISRLQRETEAQLAGLALSPTAQLVSGRVSISTQHSNFSPFTVFITIAL